MFRSLPSPMSRRPKIFTKGGMDIVREGIDLLIEFATLGEYQRPKLDLPAPAEPGIRDAPSPCEKLSSGKKCRAVSLVNMKGLEVGRLHRREGAVRSAEQVCDHGAEV